MYEFAMNKVVLFIKQQRQGMNTNEDRYFKDEWVLQGMG